MLEQFQGIAGYGLALGFGVWGSLLWDQKRRLQTQLTATLNRLNQLTTKEDQARRSLEEIQREMGKKTQGMTRLEEAVKIQTQEREVLFAQHAALEAIVHKEKVHHADQLEHLQAQVEALTGQLVELDQEKRRVRLIGEDAAAQERERGKAQIAQLEAQVRHAERERDQAVKKAMRTETKAKDLSATLAGIDATAIDKARQQTRRFHHLYQLMRGHKEMAEERSRNWEEALRILSQWILRTTPPSGETTLPHLVTAALEAIHHGPLYGDFGSREENAPDAYTHVLN